MFPRIRRSLRLLALALIGTLVGFACGTEAPEEGEGDLPVIKIHALEGGVSAVAIRVIEEQGFDEANGFQGEFFEVGGDASLQFLLQRNSDISFDCDTITAALLREQGNEISTFYPLVTQDASLVVRGDSPYESPEDLVGERVGHDGLESGTLTAAQIIFDAFYDVQIVEDYDMQLTEEPVLIRLVDRGELEGVFVGQPRVLEAELEFGMKRIWGPAGEDWAEQSGGGSTWLVTVCAYEDYLVENPDLARAAMAAWDDALAWIQEDPSRLTEDPFPELFGIDNPEILEAFANLVGTTEYFTNRWTEAEVQAGRDFNQFAADKGLIIEEADPRAVVSLDELVD